MSGFVRTLKEGEQRAGAAIVAQGMLGSLDPSGLDEWTETWELARSHGAFTDDEKLVGLARWFDSEISLPYGSVPNACVTAVAVLPTHRRQGHLTRLMEAQLAAIADEGFPMATLLAAEWPIYGRFGYGYAVPACRWHIDTKAARFLAEPTGAAELVSLEELRPHLQNVHQARWARTPAAVTRADYIWDRLAGVRSWPGDKSDTGLRRGVVWRDESGEVLGAARYTVEEIWIDNRPKGKASVTLLVGATPEAERELWRHLCSLDWVATVDAGDRSVDDPLPFFLADGRAATQVDTGDCIWARVLDVPTVFGRRRPPVASTVVVEVVDPLGYADGRWRFDLGPDGGEVTPSGDPAEMTVPIHALSAMSLGGTSASRLLQAGVMSESAPGAAARLDALLHSPIAPWSPTTY